MSKNFIMAHQFFFSLYQFYCEICPGFQPVTPRPAPGMHKSPSRSRTNAGKVTAAFLFPDHCRKSLPWPCSDCAPGHRQTRNKSRPITAAVTAKASSSQSQIAAFDGRRTQGARDRQPLNQLHSRPAVQTLASPSGPTMQLCSTPEDPSN